MNIKGVAPDVCLLINNITDVASHEPSRPTAGHPAPFYIFCGTISFLLMKAAVSNARIFIYKKQRVSTRIQKRATMAHSMSETPLLTPLSHRSARLTGSATAGDVLALGALLSTSDAVSRPGPARAGALAAEQVGVGAGRGNTALDASESEVGDGDTGGGGAGGAAVLVVLLDDDTVLGDVAEADVLEGHAGDLAGSTGNRLDPDAVVRVDDLAVLDVHSVDGVVGPATNRSNRQAMSSSAGAAGKGDVCARVDGQAVVLVVHNGARDVDVLGGADVEGISVVAELAAVTSRVVVGHVDNVEVGGRVDAHELDWRVLDVEARDGGLLQGVGVEELGLGLATVGTLAIPPLGAVAIDDVARGAGDSNVGSGDRDEWALPFLVSEGSGALEDDLAWGRRCQCKGSLPLGPRM